MTTTTWSPSNISQPIPMRGDTIEFRSIDGEYHDFTIIVTTERVVFGGVCNTGFLESGYIVRESGEGLNDTLRELVEDLETYYNDGAAYTSRIICNERM